jgi:tRNA-specific 2-thiouridylase
LGGSFGQPRYVVSIDALTRVVRVGARSALQIHRVRVNNVRWLITDPEIGTEIEADVQIRSRHKPQPAQLLIEADGVSVQFQEPVLAPAPGQAAVFYSRDAQVLGGGFIAPGR